MARFNSLISFSKLSYQVVLRQHYRFLHPLSSLQLLDKFFTFDASSKPVMFRPFSSSLKVTKGLTSQKVKSVDVDGLINILNHPDSVIIDVREPSEIAETGSLPGSLNIPSGQVSEALNMSPESFRSKYGNPKPTLNQEIVFSCRSGKRSLVASEIATKVGYKKVINFEGGWNAWESHASGPK